jgi:hypothetical protein
VPLLTHTTKLDERVESPNRRLLHVRRIFPRIAHCHIA